MVVFIIGFIHLAAQVITILVIVDVLLGYFMSPYQPVRQTMDRLVEPMLSPIRRVVPAVGMIDFSPIILVILIQVVEYLLIRILSAFG